MPLTIRFLNLSLIGLLLTFAGPSLADTFKNGSEAFKAGDRAKAAEIWKPLADGGHPGAQLGMGMLHRRGDGVELNFVKARDYFHAAAVQGVAPAQYRLGLMYRKTAITQDEYDEAYRWMQSSAEQGFGKAQYHLGFIYLRGEGVDKDPVKAYQWLDRAANGGIKSARKIADRVMAKLTPAQKAALSGEETTDDGEEMTIGVGGTLFVDAADFCTNAKDGAERAMSETVFFTRILSECVSKGNLEAECASENKDSQAAYFSYLEEVANVEKFCNKGT